MPAATRGERRIANAPDHAGGNKLLGFRGCDPHWEGTRDAGAVVGMLMRAVKGSKNPDTAARGNAGWRRRRPSNQTKH
jgi:hypothetical protein